MYVQVWREDLNVNTHNGKKMKETSRKATLKGHPLKWKSLKAVVSRKDIEGHFPRSSAINPSTEPSTNKELKHY